MVLIKKRMHKVLACFMALALSVMMVPSFSFAVEEPGTDTSAAGVSAIEQTSEEESSDSTASASSDVAEEADADAAPAAEADADVSSSSSSLSSSAEQNMDAADKEAVEDSAAKKKAADEESGIAPQSDADIQSALAASSGVTIETTTGDVWSTQTADGKTYAQAEGPADAKVTAVVPEGTESEWLIFQWRYLEKGSWQQKTTVAVDGVQVPYATLKTNPLGASSSSSLKWETVALQLTTGSHSITWDTVDTSSTPCHFNLGQVRLAGMTSVSAGNNGNATAAVKVSDADVTNVAPGTEVSFTAVAADGFVFEGWKNNLTDADYVSTLNPYKVTIWDTATTLYACAVKAFDGDGTEASPFQISTVDDLKKLNSYTVAGNGFDGSCFKLMNDIDLSSTDFAGITGSFKGNFDGDGKTISNLASPKGLFSLVETYKVGDTTTKPVIENLSVLDATISGGTEQFIGIIAGRCNGDISNCTTSGTVASGYTGNYDANVGGVVGFMGGDLTDCSSSATVTAVHDSNIYGAVGGVVGSANAVVSGCSGSGTVTAEDSTAIGGVVGRATMVATVSDCYSTATVKGKNSVGGICGYTAKQPVSNCRYSGDVTATNEKAGGIVGSIEDSGFVKDCLATGTVTAVKWAGGIGGYATKACTISGNIALNSDVSVSGSLSGRVLGEAVDSSWNGKPTLANNYAYDQMKVDGSVVTTDTDADKIQGANRTADDLYGSTVVSPYDTWSSDSWTVAAGACPVLAAGPDDQSYPDYIPAPSELLKALKAGSTLPLEADGNDDLWHGVTEGDRTYAVGDESSAANVDVAKVEVEGAGWLIFDWKLNKNAGGWSDKVGVLLDGTSKATIAPNSSSNLDWVTYVLPVSAGTHTVSWQWAGVPNDSQLCLDEMRFVTTQTAVTATADANTTATVNSAASDNVDPGSTVSFAAAAKAGYIFKGWKATAESEDFVSQDATYSVKVYDEPVTLYAVSEKPFEGEGTESSPFLIKTADDLKTLSSFTASGNTFKDTFFQVANDIDASESDFAGIEDEFDGTFDGNGKTISGLTHLTQGLFAEVGDDATVKDLTVDATVSATKQYAGIIAGTVNGTISGCTVKGSITSSEKSVGGVAGKVSGTVSGVTMLATVSSTNDNNTSSAVGGIAGESSFGCAISNCYVGAAVSGGTTASAVGGILGKSSSTTTITDCLVKADVTAKNYAGGIVGYATSAANTSGCRYDGNVTASGNYAGGIIGENECNTSSMAIKDNMATGTVKAADYAGGIVGSTTKAGSFTNNIALQSAITATTNAGRVAGENKTASWGGASTLGGNYAYDKMTVNGTVIPSDNSEVAADKIHGADRTVEELKGSSVVAPYDSWSSSSWDVTAGECPVQNNISEDVQTGYPSYIPSDIATATVAAIPNQSFTGSAIKPAPVVTIGEKTLASGTDYTVVYKDSTGNVVDPTEAGTYTVEITGAGDYFGTKTTTFKIVAGSLDGATIGAVASHSYDGNAFKPTPAVTLNGATLVKDTDYTISYTDAEGTAVAAPTNAGSYKVVVTGAGNYAGTVNKDFTISQASMTVSASDKTKTYDGSALNTTATASVTGMTVKYMDADGKYTLDACPSITNVSSLVVKFQASDPNGNYASATGQATLTINKATTMTVSAPAVNKTYDGKAYGVSATASVSTATVKYGNSASSCSLDASPTFTDVGVYTVYFKATDANYADATGSATVTITPAGTMSVSASPVTAVYSGNSQGVTATSNVEGATIAYGTTAGTYDKTESPKFTDVGVYTVYFKATDKNYADATGSTTVTITPAAIAVSGENVSHVYDGEAVGVTAKADVSGATIKYGTTSGSCTASTSPTFTDVGTYTVYFKAEAPNGNYTDSPEGSATVIITASPLPNDAIAAIADQTYTGGAITPAPVVTVGGKTLAAGTDYTVVYKDANGTVVAAPTQVGSYTVEVTGMGSYTGTTSLPFNIVAPKVTDSATGVSAEGTVFVDKAAPGEHVELLVDEIASTDSRYEDLESSYKTDDAELFVAYDVNLDLVNDTSGSKVSITENFGKLTITFPVGAQYNGRTAKVVQLHKKADGSTEVIEYKTTVADGNVVVTVDKLSEFLISIDKAEDPAVNPDSPEGSKVSSTTSGTSTGKGSSTASTGDTLVYAGSAATAFTTALIAACCAAWVRRRRKDCA